MEESSDGENQESTTVTLQDSLKDLGATLGTSESGDEVED